MDVRTLCLGVLSFGDATGYEIKKYFEEAFSHFFVAGYGSIYPALAELAEEGLVRVRDQIGDRRAGAKVYQLTGGRIPLIGIGGIESGATALQKIEAGATLIQLYTALVYEGPSLIERIKDHLVDAVDAAGAGSIQELVGRRADDWAAREIRD